MKRFLYAALALGLAFLLCRCAYLPWGGETETTETETREESSEAPTDDSTETTLAVSESDTETTEADTGFPNDPEPDGTKRY